MEYLHDWNQPVDLQGIDVRLLDEDQCNDLASLKHYNAIKIAWDNPRQNIDEKIELLLDYIKPSKILCYVLIGFWSTPQEDYHRVRHLWDKYRIVPYIMPYHKYDVYENAFSRWVNRFFFKTQDWHDFQHKRRWNSELDKIYCNFPREI